MLLATIVKLAMWAISLWLYAVVTQTLKRYKNYKQPWAVTLNWQDSYIQSGPKK